MDERRQPAPTPTTGASSAPDEILAVIAAEEMAARGLLDRRGLGLGAVYTLAATAATETTA